MIPDHRIPAIDRAIEVLDVLAVQGSASITALSTALSIPRSTVYRLLNSLEAHAVVVKDGDGTYQLGPRLLRWGYAVGLGTDLVSTCRPFMDRLARELAESVKLSMLDDNSALVVAVAESPGSYSVSTRVGRRFPLHAGAASKVLLAYSSEASPEQLRQRSLDRLTPHTLTDPLLLEAALRTVRAEGLARDDAEYTEGVSAVAAPVFDAAGTCVAALSVPFFPGSSEEHIATISRGVRETAAAISQHMGARR